MLEVESSLLRRDNEMLKDVLNSLIARRLKAIFSDLFVLPNWRSFDFPLINYNRLIIPELEPTSVDLPAGTSLDSLTTGRNALTGRIAADPLAKDTSAVRGAMAGTGRSVSNQSLSASTALDQQPVPNAGAATSSTTAGESVISSFYPRRRSSSSTLIPDILSQKCFSLATQLTSQNIGAFQERLVRHCMALMVEGNRHWDIFTTVGGDPSANAAAQTVSPQQPTPQLQQEVSRDMWLSSHWETIRNRKEIHVQKKSVLVQGIKAEVYRGCFVVNKCNAEKTFQVLSNLEHNRHVEDTYAESVSLEKFDANRSIRKIKYITGRQQERFLYVAEIKQKIPMASGDGYLVVYRSVKPPVSIGSAGTLAETLFAAPSSSTALSAGTASTAAISPTVDNDEGSTTTPPSTVQRVSASSSPRNSVSSIAVSSNRPMSPKTFSRAAPASGIVAQTVVAELANAASNGGMTASASTKITTSATTKAKTALNPETSLQKSASPLGPSPRTPVLGGPSSPAAPSISAAASHDDANSPLIQATSSNAIPESIGFVHLLAYFVENVHHGNSSMVTILSQYGTQSLQRLDVNWNRCQRTKLFVEELANWTSMVEGNGSGSVSAGGSGTRAGTGRYHYPSQLEPSEMGIRRISGNSSSEKWKFYLSSNLRKAQQLLIRTGSHSQASSVATSRTGSVVVAASDAPPISVAPKEEPILPTTEEPSAGRSSTTSTLDDPLEEDAFANETMELAEAQVNNVGAPFHSTDSKSSESSSSAGVVVHEMSDLPSSAQRTAAFRRRAPATMTTVGRARSWSDGGLRRPIRFSKEGEEIVDHLDNHLDDDAVELNLEQDDTFQVVASMDERG